MANIKEFKEQEIGSRTELVVRVQEIHQTTGPTLFNFYDGSGFIVGKSFAGGGIRAHPEIETGDIVNIVMTLKEWNGKPEAAIVSISKVNEDEAEKFEKNIDNPFEKHKFIIKNNILDLLRDRMVNVATIIKNAVMESRPIYLRHHADCDGYCGAIALERAIIKLIDNVHGDERAKRKFFKRMPSRTPFYDYSDATKDLSMAVEENAKFHTKEPLILLVDNGSTADDVLAIKKVKLYNLPVAVIDHHQPTDSENEYIDGHVNPHLVGGDSNITAGMLSAEVAKFLDEKAEVVFLAALSGAGDRSQGEAMDEYLKKSGYERTELRKIADVVDFEAFHLKYTEARGIVDDLLGNDGEKQQKMVELLYPEIQRRREIHIQTALNYVKLEDVGRFKVASINIEDVIHRGEYPPAGKVVGMLNDELSKKYSNLISLGIAGDFITIRAVGDININSIVMHLQEIMPYAMPEGGGHDLAGTIKFVHAGKDEVLNYIRETIRNA